MVRSTVSVLVVLLAIVADADAVTNDLRCFKVTNQSLKGLKALIDLDTPSVGVAAGCKLTKPKFYCVPSDSAAQPGTVFDGKVPKEPLQFFGPALDRTQVCYGVKCKKKTGTAPDLEVTSTFGTHRFTKLDTSLLCAPLTPPPNAIRSSDVEVPAGQEITYCFHFRTTNRNDAMVKTWRSRLPAHARDITVFFTKNDQRPPGTQSTTDCGVSGSGSEVPAWTYFADQPEAEFTFPADDGSGKPVGQLLRGGQAGYVRIHYVNDSDVPVTGHIEVDAIPYPQGQEVTRADSYIAYNGTLSIPPQSLKTETKSCTVPMGAKFFSLSTHTHRRSLHTFLRDGGTTVFDSTNNVRPGSVRFDAPSFFSFASGKLTYQCDYANTSNVTILSGDSTEFDEQCVAVGFFFPSTGSRFCFNDTLVPQ